MPPHRLLALLLPLLLLTASRAWAEDAPPADVSAETLTTHVRWLAAPERKGRGAWQDREASAAYVERAFRAAGLHPLPGRDAMFLDTPGVKEPALRNVAAWLPGVATADGEYVILSAHYDHLGQRVTETAAEGSATVRTTTTFHGADDNATGVAALLEIARVLGTRHAQEPQAFPRALVFVAFDLEEQNLVGSRRYVTEPPLPLARCAAFLTMDQLGRSLADLTPGTLFLMGTEHSAALEAQVRELAAPAEGAKAILGIDFQPGYSDYVPFHEARIPYVFVTSGACADYHQPTDVAARIDGPQLLARTRWVRDLTMRIVGGATRPVWREAGPPQVAEMETLRALLTTAQENLAGVQGLPPMAGVLVGNYTKYLEKILADGVVTAEERGSARLGVLNLFKMAIQLASR